MGTSSAALARARERVFVKALARRLLAVCGDEESARVFHKHDAGYRAFFGVDGLPADICVCRMGIGERGTRQPQPFDFAAGAHWLADVDFSRDLESALRAVNRLNMGGAGQKLLVLAQDGRGGRRTLDALGQAFAGGGQYVALAPHPDDWDDSDSEPSVWQWRDGEWQAL